MLWLMLVAAALGGPIYLCEGSKRLDQEQLKQAREIVREREAIRPTLRGSEILATSEAILHDTRSKDLPTGDLPLLWQQLGAYRQWRLYLRQEAMSDAEIARVRRLFPEAEIWVQPRGKRVYTRSVKE